VSDHLLAVIVGEDSPAYWIRKSIYYLRSATDTHSYSGQSQAQSGQ
jgi:hypothetical protein